MESIILEKNDTTEDAPNNEMNDDDKSVHHTPPVAEIFSKPKCYSHHKLKHIKVSFF